VTEPQQLIAEVLVADTVSADREQRIAEAFRSLEITARTRVVPTRRSLGDVQWLVLALVPLQAFLSGLGSIMAEDAHRALRRLVGQVLKEGSEVQEPDQVLVLQDSVTRMQVVLEADLPADAYQQLIALNFSQIRHGPIHYDRQRRAWRSELDEWERRSSSRTGDKP
jgi:hypothetical protein